jgi:hypothetical protein
MSRDQSIHLLGKRVVQIMRAQARLDMPERDTPIKSRQGRRHHGRGIPLSQHGVWRNIRERFVQRGNQSGRQLRQRLVVAHDVQIQVRTDAEQR